MVNVEYGDNYELLFYSNIIYTFNIISIIWGTKLWMKDFVKNVITYVIVLRQIILTVNVRTVNVDKKEKIKLMNRIYLVLALLFALSACSVGPKCLYTDEGTRVSSWVWFFNGEKPAEIDKLNCNK